MNQPRNLYNELYKLRNNQSLTTTPEDEDEDFESEVEVEVENIEDEFNSDEEDNESRLKLDLEIFQLMNNSNDKIKFQKKYKQLEDDSLRRFWQRNQEIFNKYSKIDDSKQSDEIDIVTGEIITNNGHLELLTHNNNNSTSTSTCGGGGNVWRVDYNRYLKDLKDVYDNDDRDNEFEDDLIMKYSPTKGKVPSGLNTEESPTKKRKLNIKQLNDDDEDDDEDTGDYDDYYDSIIVNDKPMKLNHDIPLVTSKLEKLIIPNLNNPILQPSSTSTSTSISISTSSSSSSSETEDFPTSTSPSLEPQPLNHDKLSFDEEYQIIEDPLSYLLSTPTTSSTSSSPSRSFKIYQCAFKSNCHYCTGNRKLYESHLLKFHSLELSKLGYPIIIITNDKLEKQPEEDKEINLQGIDFINLFNDFPKKIKLPTISKIYYCNYNNCKKFYLNENLLNNHNLKFNDCSSKIPVLFCPILGCGFMTDCGYQDWKNHMIDSNHGFIIQENQDDDDDDDDGPIEVKQEIIDDKELIEKRPRLKIIENNSRRIVNIDVPKFQNLDKKIDLKFMEIGHEPTIDELFK